MAVNSSAGAAEAKAAAKNPNLRLFTVKKTAKTEPQTDVPTDGNNGKWLEAGPDTIGGFSAVVESFAGISLLHFCSFAERLPFRAVCTHTTV